MFGNENRIWIWFLSDDTYIYKYKGWWGGEKEKKKNDILLVMIKSDVNTQRFRVNKDYAMTAAWYPKPGRQQRIHNRHGQDLDKRLVVRVGGG